MDHALKEAVQSHTFKGKANIINWTGQPPGGGTHFILNLCDVHTIEYWITLGYPQFVILNWNSDKHKQKTTSDKYKQNAISSDEGPMGGVGVLSNIMHILSCLSVRGR